MLFVDELGSRSISGISCSKVIFYPRYRIRSKLLSRFGISSICLETSLESHALHFGMFNNDLIVRGEKCLKQGDEELRLRWQVDE